MLILRAWSIWRAKQGGWAAARESRARELAAQVVRFEADLRAAQGAEAPPLLGSARAHREISEWVPEVVAALFH